MDGAGGVCGGRKAAWAIPALYDRGMACVKVAWSEYIGDISSAQRC